MHPDYRGRGLAVAGMAAVVRDALRRVAPTVSLYVNDYNHPARRVYERCGFKQVGHVRVGPVLTAADGVPKPLPFRSPGNRTDVAAPSPTARQR